VTELRPAGQTKGQEGNAQAVEAATCILGRVQGCCLVVQGWHQKSQGAAGDELDAENNKKGFYRYVSQKRKAKAQISPPPPMNKTGKLARTDKEKAEDLNKFFASACTGNLSSQTSQVGGPPDGDWGS